MTNKEVVKDKKVLNLLVASNINNSHIDFLTRKYEVKLHNGIDLDIPIDLILFTEGEEDVNPDNYNEKLNKHSKTNLERDKKEFDVFSQFPKFVPKLGIGRGAQILSVLSGARLIQHVEGHQIEGEEGHTIETTSNPFSRFYIPSHHHQMMYPYDLPSNKYDVIAHSHYFRSETYLNGSNAEINIPDFFLEPEIVYYPITNSLCIQGHPHVEGVESNTVDYSLTLIEKLIKQELRQKIK